MKVVIVGTGYVGLVSGACLADTGSDVVCVDTDEAKIADLHQGRMPIYEPGLGEVVTRAVASRRLRFSTELAHELPGTDTVFIAVGTPSSADGTADLSFVENVGRTIGRHITNYIVVVTKSTVPVGTATMLHRVITEELAARGTDIEFDVASNPEFLKEGVAVADFMKPDRIVIGVDSARARAVLERVYRPFVLNGHPVMFMDIASAEITKYAANAMLAMRVSFMNLMAQLCDATGADIGSVRRGIGADDRIGSRFLYAGVGYGGSCFPKDVRALAHTGEAAGICMDLLHATEAINERQKLVLVDRAHDLLGTLMGRRIAVWGLAFKPNTDDMREAPALAIVAALVSAGAHVVAYDPVAVPRARDLLGDSCQFVADAYGALDDADALMLVTEWPEFRTPDLAEMTTRMRGRLVLDGRNVLDATELRDAGFVYCGIGLGQNAGVGA